MKEDFKEIHQYDDIINLPHHKSTKRPHMSKEKRAAQFSPFAAVTGYDEAVKEKARLTDKRIDLDENEKTRLDDKLKVIKEHLPNKPDLAITYFQPDENKAGGSYLTACGIVKKIDYYERVISMEDKRRIYIDEIFDISGEILSSMDNLIL